MYLVRVVYEDNIAVNTTLSSLQEIVYHFSLLNLGTVKEYSFTHVTEKDK